MNFFGKNKDIPSATEQVEAWLGDAADATPFVFRGTSIPLLSKRAAAEINMPQGTALAALYKLQKKGILKRQPGGSNKFADYAVDLKRLRAPKPEAEKKSDEPKEKIEEVIIPAETTSPSVSVKSNGASITITIKIEM